MRRTYRRLLPITITLAVLTACSSSHETPDATTPEAQQLLPPNTRGVLAIEPSSTGMADLPDDHSPGWSQVHALLANRLQGIDNTRVDALLLLQTTEAEQGSTVIASVITANVSELFPTTNLQAASPYRGQGLWQNPDTGFFLTLLAGNHLVIGNAAGVQAVVDTLLSGQSVQTDGAMADYLAALQGAHAVRFAYGMPQLYRPVANPGPGEASLRQTLAITGHLSGFEADAKGTLSFHTANASEYATRFNQLAADTTLPILQAGAIDRVDLELPPVSDSAQAATASWSALFKQLIYGMDAVDYADGVMHGGNTPWMNFDVGENPNSIFINFEFADAAARAQFEASELPAGFKLAPLQIIEGEAPRYFLVLNIYQSSGGLVAGARAEWSVFVEDPDSGVPRFLVIQAAAENTAADSVNLLTPPEPVSHTLDDTAIRSYVGVEDAVSGEEQNYFRSSIPWPQEVEDRVQFARQFVVANDYIYWGNGVADRGLYNASVHNRDAIRFSGNSVAIEDDSRWQSYIKPEPVHTLVYLNPLAIVISPWWNLDAPYLDVTEDYRQQLISFKNSFYPLAVQNIAAAAIAGNGDALATFTTDNQQPELHFHFPILDTYGMEQALELPNGTSLARTMLTETDASGDYYLTLRVYRIKAAMEGLRAEWSVTVTDGKQTTHTLVVDMQSEDAGFDPERFINLPSVLEGVATNGQYQVRIETDSIALRAVLYLDASDQVLASRDWIESGDRVCRPSGSCDHFFYDGQTLTAPLSVHGPSQVRFDQFTTPWNAYIAEQPVLITLRTQSRRVAWNPMVNIRH